jgi:hypothetical protein
MARQLHLGAFMRPTTIHTGGWRYPGAFPDAKFNFEHLKRFAKTLSPPFKCWRHSFFCLARTRRG